MNTRISAKKVVFVGIMGALGNVLSGLSMLLVPLAPALPLGPYNISVALDLSHLTTFIAALYGGSAIGGLTGLIGGLIAAYEFGFSKGNWVTGLTLPIGKAITGVVAGIIMRILIRNRNGHWGLIIVSTLLSYVPEAGFTALIFLGVFPMVFGTPALILYPVVVTILVKAFIEMFAEGGVISILNLNRGFTEFIRGFFSKS